MHIVLTVNAAWNIANFRRGLVQALTDDGHRITVLAPPDDSVADLEALGCAFVPLEMSVKGLNPLRDLALLLRLRRHFESLKPDVVLGFTIKNNLFGALAATPLGIPFIPNVTGLGTAFLSGGALQRVAQGLYRRAFRALPVVFFQNADDRDLFTARGLVREGQARLLPGSGIDLDRFAPAAWPVDGPTTFLMIARLLRDKGVLEYVEAARRLRSAGRDVRFRLLGAAGSANRTAITREEVAVWEAEGIIDYLGTAPDVRPHIAEAQCVVLPSYREGAPRTLIEAAACARPVIATDVPGCRAVVEDGRTGLLCAARSGESLAWACMAFLDLPQEARIAMGAAGRAKMAAEFDERLVAEGYLTAIRRVAGQAS